MASNKRGAGLDQPARSAVTALDALLAELADSGMRPDEFTVAQAHELHVAGGGERSYDAIARMLDRRVSAGTMAKRKVIVDGKHAIAYSAV